MPQTDLSPIVRPSEEVAAALADGAPVVSLESTVYSNLGLPSPQNETALHRCITAIREAGAVPAVTAVLDGELRAGLEDSEYDQILGEAQKAAERDLAVAIGQKWPVGATTVSASLAISASIGVRAFATGGIGGVHRGSEHTGDISADLGAIARHGVATVSAGAKSFLDLPRTLEALETLGATVLGWQTEVLPAFTARQTPHGLPYCIDSLDELAAIAAAQTGFGRGILIANPVPVEDALDQATHDEALEAALGDIEAAGITGAKVTPFVLERIAEVSGGASVPANISLVANNARLAGEVAVAMQRLQQSR